MSKYYFAIRMALCSFGSVLVCISLVYCKMTGYKNIGDGFPYFLVLFAVIALVFGITATILFKRAKKK